ncbi:MAG: S41 family peptidase [Alphaproteobacteria bacterium]|nr:S41 family peptidase [Alphaproteobacteria bacterium]
MSTQNRWLGGLLVVVVAIFFLPHPSSLRADLADEQRSYHVLGLLGEAFERVRDNYVEDIEDEVLIEAAIKGMMTALDPHSDYLDAKHFDDMRTKTQGQFGGLGIEVTLDETGYIRVVSPIDDTPAAEAGIMPGDLITHINNTELAALTLTQAVEKMRGPVNSPIDLKILRDNSEIISLTLIRKVIQIRSVRNRVIEGEIGYIRITKFNGRTTQSIERAISSLDEKNPSKIKAFIIDLRNNPGGLFEGAVQVSDGFLDRGEIVSIRGRNDKRIQRFQAIPGDWTQNRPIVVLINGGSASSSEILAGALQDHERATLIGTSSFGKGSVQTIIPLSRNNAALKLTTQYYYTPSGRSIAKVGLTPDIEIANLKPIVKEDGSLVPSPQDVQLEKAVEFLQQQAD